MPFRYFINLAEIQSKEYVVVRSVVNIHRAYNRQFDIFQFGRKKVEYEDLNSHKFD